MVLLQAKKDIETFFNNNYNETDVHWAGMNFDTSKYAEWVYFEYRSRMVADCGLDNTEYTQKGAISITIMSDLPFRNMEIADVILELFKGVKIGDMFAKSILIDEQGFIKELNKSFIDLEISMETY